MHRWIRILSLASTLALTATSCAGGNSGDNNSGSLSGGSTSGGSSNVTATTITVTSVTITATGGGLESSGGDGDPSSTGMTTVDPTTGAVGDSSSGGGTAGDTGDDTASTTDDPSTTGAPVVEVSWCRLQFPSEITVEVDEPFTAYVRLYAEGLTDQTSGTDPSPDLLVEFGYGEDGSDPSMGAAWTWGMGTPNIGWDDMAEPNNDEYLGDIAISMEGVFDFAARISDDGGTSWVYCDLNDLLTGGYTPDQAGSVTVTSDPPPPPPPPSP